MALADTKISSSMPSGVLVPEAVSVQVVPPDATIAQAQPVLLPEAEVLQTFEQLGMAKGTLENDSEYTMATATAVAVPEGQFFAAHELDFLNAQPARDAPPQDNPVKGPQIRGDVLLRPENGAMPIVSQPFSGAKLKRDAMKHGVKSCDPILNNKDEIVQFFNMLNSRPKMFVDVEGYHHETRTTRDSNGNTSTSRHKVTDFHYQIDITGFVYPFGKITVKDSKHGTVEDMIEDFLNDRNRMASLQMKKKVVWNQAALCRLVYMYIRSLGWHRELKVFTFTRNKSVRVAKPSKLASMYDSRGGRALMIMTVIPALTVWAMGHGHRERGMRSIFVIEASPLQVFEAIRPQIWVPHRRGCVVM